MMGTAFGVADELEEEKQESVEERQTLFTRSAIPTPVLQNFPLECNPYRSQNLHMMSSEACSLIRGLRILLEAKDKQSRNEDSELTKSKCRIKQRRWDLLELQDRLRETYWPIAKRKLTVAILNLGIG